MPPQPKRQHNQQATATIPAKTEPKEPFTFFDSSEVLKRTSMYQSKDEIFPTLPFDFSTLEINQPFISMDTEDLILFSAEHELKEGSKVWISDGNLMILSSLKTREDIKTLTIHWCERQYVVVRGDSSDFDGPVE